MTDAQEARIMAAISAATQKIMDALAGSRPSAPATPRAASTGGACFPNYGRRKNEPVEGSEIGDLEYYASGCRRSLDNPEKARWHDKERALLAAIEAEIARQGGESPDTGSTDEIPF